MIHYDVNIDNDENTYFNACKQDVINDDVNTDVNACLVNNVNNDGGVNTDVNTNVKTNVNTDVNACVPGWSCERANVKGQSPPQEQKHQWKVRKIFILLLLIKYHVGCWI